jgi:RimJ/RimL family protein N-acetyltransferase
MAGEAAPPRLETARLHLAPHTAADFEGMAAMWADPEVVRHISGRPSSREEAWHRLLRYRGLWSLLGFGYLAVRERASGRFVGDVGFADFHRGIEPSIDGLPEAGWVLATWAHGRGFATEALAAALRWLDRETEHRRAVCIMAPANAASRRVAEKAGFGVTHTLAYNGEATLLLARDRPA